VHADEEQARLRGDTELAERITVFVQHAVNIQPWPFGDEARGEDNRADAGSVQIQFARRGVRLPVQVHLFGNVAGVVGAWFGPRGVVPACQ